MYDFDEDEEGGRSLGRTVGIGAAVVVLAALGWFVVKPRLFDDDGNGAVGAPNATATTTVGGSVESAPAGSTLTDGDPTTTAAGATTTTAAGTTTSGSSTTTTVAPTTTRATTTTTLPPPTTAAPTFATMPDGSPAPVIVTFDTNSITLAGAVPDAAAKQRLQDLAVASSKPGQADRVDNQITINPAVPRTVGARVVELTSTRFPDGSSEILPPHAAELDRAVNIMNALPNVSALIIGHADQRGDNLTNYAISEQRALAVKNYMISKGVAATRLSSRAVGEEDLITLDNDDAALALNRRTEFVFIGLLIE